MSATIDLNADLGEGDAGDAELLGIVSSCNIACGGHAGDPQSMAVTVAAALANNVAIGAHPSYPDRDEFGRRAGFLSGEALLASLLDQLLALDTVCKTLGASITHLKPHGALYNDAADNADLAAVIAAVIEKLPGRLSLVGPPGSELEKMAKLRGVKYVREACVDRGYLANGRLVARSDAGAVHDNLDKIVSQAVSIAVEKSVCSLGGEVIPIAADTLCVHGDTPGAAVAARRVRDALQQEGVKIRAVGR